MLKRKVLSVLLSLVLIISTIGFLPQTSYAAATIQNYPMPSIYTSSSVFSLKADDTSVPVINYEPNYDYAEFSFSGTVTLEVTASEDITSYSISPLAKNITGTVNGNKLTFTLSTSTYVIVEINGLKKLVIAADPLETDIPASSGAGIYNVTSSPYNADSTGATMATTAIQNAIDDANAAGGGIVYVPAGVFKCGNLTLKSDVTLYLAGGSVIVGTGNGADYRFDFNKSSISDGTYFISTAIDSSNITIRGRGTIDGKGFEMRTNTHFINNLLVPLATSNFTFDGVILRDGGFWAFMPVRSDNVKITNYKGFQRFGKLEADAIDINESQDVLVKHAIAISEDDSYSTKTWPQKGMSIDWPGAIEHLENVTFDDCLAWSECVAFKMGQGICTPQINVTFKNSYVYQSARSLLVDHSYTSNPLPVEGWAKDITFENIDIERVDINQFGNYWFGVNTSTAGDVSNVVFKNINVRATGTQSSRLSGNPTRGGVVNGVTFTDVYVNGKLAQNLADLKAVEYNSHVTGVRVANSKPPLFSDNFENGKTNWTPSSGTWNVISDTADLVNTTQFLKQVAGTGSPYLISAGDSTWEDYSFEAKMKTAGSNTAFGMVFRFVDSNNYYMYRINMATNQASRTVDLYKCVGGSMTQLSSIPFTTAVSNTWYTLKVEIEGNTIQGYVDGILKTTYTNPTTELTAGKIGLRTTSINISHDDVVVLPINHAPTDISLTNDSVAENTTPGGMVGTFATTDADADETFFYSLETGTGDTDNNSFTILENNKLLLTTKPDFEVKNSYSIRVRTTDIGNNTFEKVFTINISDMDETPMNSDSDVILLSDDFEDGDIAGWTTATGTWSVVTDGTKALNQEDSTTALITAGSPLLTDYAYEARMKLPIDNANVGMAFRVMDANNYYMYRINGTSNTLELYKCVNNVMTRVGLTGFSPTTNQWYTVKILIHENTIQGYVDGELKTQWTNPVTELTTGGIGLRTTTQQASFDDVSVTGLRTASTEFTLSNTTVAENTALGTSVGLFSNTGTDTYTYTLVAGDGAADNGSFTISGNSLLLGVKPDYEVKDSYNIRVRGTDSLGRYYEKAFTINITDLDEIEILFKDNFEDGDTEGWTTSTGTWGIVTDGTNKVMKQSALKTALITAGDSSWTDYSYEAKLKLAARTDANAGIVFRVKDTSNYYMYRINGSNQKLELYKCVGGTLSIISTATTPFTSVWGQWYAVKVVVKGNTIEGYVDGVLKTNYTDATAITAGKVGFRTSSQDIYYDNVVLKSLNVPPTDISLTNNSVVEYTAPGSSVGTLSSTDPDEADTFTYTLVTGDGDTDNGSFTISGNTLQTVSEFVYDTKDSYSILIRSTDAAGSFFEKQFTINITKSDVIKANASNNAVILDRSNVASGDTVTLIAVGDRQSSDGSAVGDEKYIPTTWSSTETGKYGNFIWNAGAEAYTSSYTAAEAGTHVVTATFQKQIWDGSLWVSGTTDTKTVTLQVYTPTNASGNSLSISQGSVEVGQTVVIMAEGNRQNITPTVVGDERYLPIAWNSTEDGKSGVFTVSGQVYQSSYTTSSQGVFTITAIYQKQVWDGTSWVNGAIDTNTVTLTVSPAPTAPTVPTASAENNTLALDVSSIKAGGTVIITAEGDRQNEVGTVLGEEKYIPITWSSTEDGKSGVFTVSGQVYSASYTTSSAGVFTITVIYQKQVWDGTSWVNGTIDTNEVTLSVNPAPTVPTAPTASASNNTLALDVSSIKAGGTVTITAEGDRQNEAGTVLGEEKYIPVTWSSTEDGKSGIFTVSGEVYSARYTTSAAGNYTITATFQKQSWNGTSWINGPADTKTISLTVKPHSKGGSNGESTPSETATGTNGVDILVNGKTESAGVATTTQEGDRTVTTVSIDQSKLEQKLSQEGNGAIVTIPVINKADVVVGELTGQMVKSMENKEAVLQIKTENATYTLPAAEINIDAILQQIGAQVSLADIKVKVTVATPSADTVNIVQDFAEKNSYQIVVKPVEFDITCTSGSKTVDVSKFNSYVERTIAIPDGIDSSKISTGIVLNADGTFSHVPTKITAIDGKYYAKINSLTNSTYSVIYSPKTFADVDTHWAKDAVNDMGSRLVITGVGDGKFEPDRDITRAEFAAILVKGLGLMRPGTGKEVFGDVTKDSWYYDAVAIAYEYGIIGGYGNGTFGPEDKITREQAMTMTARAMKFTGLKVEFKDNEVENLLSGFKDSVNSSDYAKDSIASCIKTGIITGRDGNLVAPESNITRAEVAVIVRRLLQKSGLI